MTITILYVNIPKYPLNHLIIYKGDFVWHIKYIYMWTEAKGNSRKYFLAVFIFFLFLPIFQNFMPFLATLNMLQLQKVQNLNSSGMINHSFSCHNIEFCHERSKKVAKNHKKCQNKSLYFPEASDHLWMHLICQTKSPL